MSSICALLAAVLLVAVGVFHAYWAAGGRWPGHDQASLARHVLGASDSLVMPPPALTGALAAAFVALAWVPLALNRLVPAPALPAWTLPGALYLGIGVFALRGLLGFFEQKIRPGPLEVPYVRLNRFFYSPLCLVVALLLFAARVP